MRTTRALAFLLVYLCSAAARADIYQWAWVDATDHSKGTCQSTTLCPDGAAVTAAPWASLGNRDLTDAYLVEANLAFADLGGSRLIGADLTGAGIQGANFYYSLLNGADFQMADLSMASLFGASLINTNFTNAHLECTDLRQATDNGFTAQQLYSTASWQSHRLDGISFAGNSMAGWDFREQELSGCNFDGANVAGADFRATCFNDVSSTGARTDNAIGPDGTINGLNLAVGERLTVRNLHHRVPEFGDGWSEWPAKIPVHVKQAMTSAGGLDLVLDDWTWWSTISFDPGIAVELGGVLRLEFAPGTQTQWLVGQTYQLFDWTGVSPQGQFDVQSDLPFDLSQLYTTGQVTFLPEPGTLLVLLAGATLMASRRKM